jgi:hypothetical protein
MLDGFFPLKPSMDPAGPPPMIGLLLLGGGRGPPGEAPEGKAALRLHGAGHRQLKHVRSTIAGLLLMRWLIELISIGLRAATGAGAVFKGGGLVALEVVICDFSFYLFNCNVLCLLQLKLCKHGLCGTGGQSQL